MKTGYRTDIEGLRAVAVLPVMLFHAKVPGFSAGFLGVDIFFVISGFLITSILIHAADDGSYSLARFYERRARRILPALFLVVMATIPAAFWLMPPDQLREFGDSVLATLAFCSNILFYHQSDYFGLAAEEKPLLHTWSLAVEEQFYLFFPLLFVALWRRSRNTALGVVAAISTLSLGLSVFAVPFGAEGNFYLIHSRAWELGTGAITAMLHVIRLHSAPEAAAGRSPWPGMAGLALILAAFVSLGGTTHHPGLPTLLPVLGTALILGWNAPGTLAHRLLSLPGLTAIGLMSYSAYLWHQPLLAFIRLAALDQPPLAVMLLALVLSLLLAALTYWMVEKPCRNTRETGLRALVKGLAAGALVLVAAGFAVRADAINLGRFSPAELQAIAPSLSKLEDCAWTLEKGVPGHLLTCTVGQRNASPPVILWGDSHAGALLSAWRSRLEQRQQWGLVIRLDDCTAVPTIFTARKASVTRLDLCRNGLSAAVRWMADRQPRGIIIANRWTLRLFPVTGAGDTPGFDNGEGGVEVESPRTNVAWDGQRFAATDEAKIKALDEFFSALGGIGAPVVVLGPVPEGGWHIPHRNFRTWRGSGQVEDRITTSYDRYLARNQFILGYFARHAWRDGLVPLMPADLLCPVAAPRRCLLQEGGIPLYADDDHLSFEGAGRVLDAALAHFPPD